MHDCSYVNIPFLKYMIYEATGGKQNILLLHNNTSYQTFLFFKAKPKIFIFKCSANPFVVGILHLTKILFSPWASTDLEFVISMYVFKSSKNLDCHLFQGREVDLETEECFGFEKMLKATYWFSYDGSKWLGFVCV